ncbi:thioredoxin domain-containing protein [Flavobacterium sp.]|uniref:thioredoxin domain-containing protein n=1 Tax=Flavobacterium sp. TaxID=239 RepID=UPI0039E6EDC9
MKTKISALLLVCLLFVNCNGQNAKSVENISPKNFAEKLKNDPEAQLLDVRTPEEFAGGHIGNAVNVDWNGGNFEAKAATYDKTKPVYVYCKIGGRASKAANKLSEMGFTKIYNLEGGILKWDAERLSAPGDKIIGMCSQEYGDLLKSDQKVLVNFYAPWCEPCKKMAPYMEKLGENYKGQLTVSRLNADENKTLTREMKIDTLPVILLYENGKVVWQHSGFISEEELKKHL